MIKAFCYIGVDIDIIDLITYTIMLHKVICLCVVKWYSKYLCTQRNITFVRSTDFLLIDAYFIFCSFAVCNLIVPKMEGQDVIIS